MSIVESAGNWQGAQQRQLDWERSFIDDRRAWMVEIILGQDGISETGKLNQLRHVELPENFAVRVLDCQVSMAGA